MSAPTRILLDSNATTRPLPEVIRCVADHLETSFANPGSRHAEGRRARQVLETSRESIADILGARPDEVCFVSGGTEASCLAILGLTGFPASEPGAVAISPGEHPATRETCRHLAAFGWEIIELPLDREGRLIETRYSTLPWQRLKLVSVILAHNETGVIQHTEPLAALCRQHGVPLHLDAVQAVGKIRVNFRELGAAALSLGAHKFHGPRGIGALLLAGGLRLTPQLFGGFQEKGLRPGTEPVALIAGMALALEQWHQNQDSRTRKLGELRDQLQAGLLQTCAPALVNGSQVHRLPNTLNIAFPGLEGEPLLVALDLAGIACSLGSACASGSAEPAPVLVAMQCEPEILQSSVRLTVSIDNTPAEIEEAIRRIAVVVHRLRDSSPAE